VSRVVGIDLGTTNSLVAYVKDGVPAVIRDETGDALVPSVISSSAQGAVSVGRKAEQRLTIDPGRTVYSVKRFMGRGVDDVRDEARSRARECDARRRSRLHLGGLPVFLRGHADRPSHRDPERDGAPVAT